jgi:hypothetical protein
MLLLLLTACTPAGTDDPAGGVTFAVPPADLGAPRASRSGFDPADGDGVGLALSLVLPVFGESNPVGANPAWDLPAEVWAILQRTDVRNAGVCPFERVDGDTTTHEGDCRTSYGYDFAGDVAERTWTEDGADRYRMDADVEVIGDTEEPVFDRIAMAGAIERAEPTDGGVDRHLDVNLHLEVEGYWDARDPDDPRLVGLQSWDVSGSLEEAGGTWVVDLAADIADVGGLGVTSAALAESDCPVEFSGEAALSADVTADFEGVDACDRCARVVGADGVDTLACAPAL